MKRSSLKRFDINYSTPPKYESIEIEDKRIPILNFQEARGREWSRMLTIEIDIQCNYANIYEMIFGPALDVFDKMLQDTRIRRNGI